ncbi:MAG: hypothetical protein ACFFHV_11850 [Promethearchaeota archaeon]
MSIILESFGLGTVVFIFYSYFIIDFLRIFNFFTAYLPLILFDSMCLIYLYFKSQTSIKNILIKTYNKLYGFLTNKHIQLKIIMLLFVFLLLILVEGVIETNLCLPSEDAYIWFDVISYLHKYGDLDYENYTVHGIGFAIFIAAALLIINDFYLQYFFIKYVAIFFFSIIILAIYNIASYYFKKNLEIFITLVVLLSFNSLLYRFSFAVPSILATTLGIILLNTLIQNENMRYFFIRGLLLGGIFLSHLLYFLFLFGYLIIYDVLILINVLKENFSIKSHKSTERIKYFIIKNGIYFLISAIVTIPYFINLLMSGKHFYENFTRYLYRGYQAKAVIFIKIHAISEWNKLLLISLKPSRSNFLFNLIFFGLDIPINKTLNWGFIFLVLGLFYKYQGKSESNDYLINFIKFSFLLTFLLFLTNSFLFVIDNNTVLSIASFINQYGKRLFELYSPVWALLFVFGYITIFSYFKEKRLKNLRGYKITVDQITAKISKKLDRFYFILLIIVGASIYSTHLYLQYNVIYTSDYKDDYLTDALLYIGDYFDEKDIRDKTIILPDNVDPKVIYRLIYHKDCKKEYIEFDDMSYAELINATLEKNADFVLVYKLETQHSCLDKIDEEEDILYENPHYLFFKT